MVIGVIIVHFMIGRDSRVIWPAIDNVKLDILLNLERMSLKTAIGLITVRYMIGKICVIWDVNASEGLDFIS